MIIVTGSSGFIGSNLIRELSNRGHKNIMGVDYVTSVYNRDLYVTYTPAEEFYANLELYHKRMNIETIFHEGAISSTTETDVKKLFKYNIKPTLDLIYFCRDNNVTLQYASSASVYGNPTIEEWNNAEKKLNPLNEYAKSKKQIDYVADLVINSTKPPKLIQGMRYFNVYGPNEDHKGDQSSPYHKFNSQFKETGKIKLFEGSKEFLRDFVSVEEVIEKKLYCMENRTSGIYEIGTGNPKSFYDIALEICGSENNIEWVKMPENIKEHYQKYTCANMEWYYSNL